MGIIRKIVIFHKHLIIEKPKIENHGQKSRNITINNISGNFKTEGNAIYFNMGKKRKADHKKKKRLFDHHKLVDEDEIKPK